MSSQEGSRLWPQCVVATAYYAPGFMGTKGPNREFAIGLMRQHATNFREELAHWFGGYALDHRISVDQVLLELREGSQFDSSGASITVVITGKVWDERERKLKIALKEIHDYLRGHPLYQASLLVRIQMGGVFLQIQSPGEDYDRDKKPIERHWSASSQ